MKRLIEVDMDRGSRFSKDVSEPQDGLERRLTEVLEARPSLRIAEDFASRTAALAAVEPRQLGAVASMRFGRLVGQCASIGLLVGMVVLVPWVRSGMQTGASIPLATELLLAIEFGILAMWLSPRARDSR